jgi:hypothetical protein
MSRHSERGSANAASTSRVIRKGLIRLAVGVSAALLVCGGLPGADEPDSDEVAKQRLEFMKRKLDEFVLSTEHSRDKPLVRVKEPVLRYSNPARSVLADGAIFVWLEGERPVAAATLWIATDDSAHREFASLSDQPLKCMRDGKTIWSPAAGGFTRKPLPDAPQPAATPALRLTQMRRLASRFTGTFEIKSAKAPEELQLLPQPIYRYSSDKGIVEGAIFALVHTNDPEVLLVLELANPTEGEPAWTYGIARASSARLRVSLDKKEVWAAELYWFNPRSPNDPYQEAGAGKFPGP